MSIAYKSQGAGAGTESNGATLNLACPATVDVNDILIAHIIYTGTATGPTTPAGWTLLSGPANVGTTATARHWAFGKIADGSEDGATIGFGTAGGTAGRAGRIYSFSGYVSGTISQVIPAASFSSVPHATDPQGPSVTTTLVGALAVALTCQDDDNTEEAIASASGGTWAGFQTYVSSTLGPAGLHIDIQVATPTANPGTISGGAMVAANDEAGTIGFEIRPVGIPVTADYGPYKTVVDGGASAWDEYFENVSCVVKFGSTYFLYYIGGDTDADEGDDWVYNRQIGVATSPDMINWTKYGSNPILTFTPEGDQAEEGIGDCKCVVYDGKVHMYYSAIRWISGGDVDVEIRYRESNDGFTFTNDTLIIDDLDEELYSSGVYVTSGGTFHLYYVGPLTGGVGDLKKLSGSDPTSLSSDGTITTNDYSSRGGIVPLDADNLLLFNDRFFDGSITCTLIKTSALGALSTVFTAINFGGSGLELPGCFFYENGQWFCFSTIGTSAAAPFDATQIILRTAPDLAEMEIAASSNIAASAATPTTAIMSAPAGKDAGDFDPGWISDDTNPGPSTDIDTDLYTELEWCLQATAYAGPGVGYEFRVSNNGVALDSYTDTPEWTIEAGATLATGSESIPLAFSESIVIFITGNLSESIPLQLTESLQFSNTQEGTESLAGNPDESAMIASTFNVNDSHSLAIQESISGSAAIQIVESLVIPIIEGIEIFNAGQILDSYSIQVIESAIFSNTIEALENHAITFDEGLTLSLNLNVTDSHSLQFNEAVTFSLFMEAIDSHIIGFTEGLSFFNAHEALESIGGLIQESTTGSNTLQVGEIISFLFLEGSSAVNLSGDLIPTTGSEDIAINFLEALGITSEGEIQEALSFQITEAIEIFNHFEVQDSIGIYFTELAEAFDTLNLPVQITASESIGISPQESLTFFNAQQSSEDIVLSLIEGSSLQISGLVAIVGSETIPVFFTEGADFLNDLALAETIQIATIESASQEILGLVLISGSEDIQILIEEIASINSGAVIGRILIGTATYLNHNQSATNVSHNQTASHLSGVNEVVKL